MRLRTAAALFILCSGPGLAQQMPDYLDDRSSAEAVVRSLYNAINRQEYLRAWTYFAADHRPDLDTFKTGYADTRSVDLVVGTAQGDGAAGTIYWTVPVAIEAVNGDGKQSVFAGCYTLYQPQPALQQVPPFAPIAIKSGSLKPAKGPLSASLPATCPTE